jgi:hypothetical protein
MTHFFRRFTLVASIVICGSLALAAAVGAAGGPPQSSESSFSNLSASASNGQKGIPPGTPQFFLNVSRGSMNFGTGKEIHSTQVFLTIFDANANTVSAGCLEIPAKDFKISESLQSASLKTTLTTSNQVCQGGKGGPPPGGAPFPGKGMANPFAGGGPPPPPPPPPTFVPLPLPIDIDVTWVGNGIVSTSHDSHSFECQNFSVSFTNSTRGSLANASGTVSAVPGTINDSGASITANQGHQKFSGTPPLQGCFGG